MRLIYSVLLTATLLALTACGGGSDRPIYSGKEESTAGVPGWTPDGQRKLHPNIKLGQSYTVRGKTYVPRYQPDYVEEGMASWYGPGFHGLKTANGERYNMGDHTAAHTTLPLPSIVKVTYLKTGLSTYARVNDRGPFAHGRIIDISKAVAEEIGMIRDGVGKVRVEYMAPESEKFIEMITTGGRDPQSIDIASEVVGKTASTTQYANIAPQDDSVQVNDIDTSPSSVPANPSVWQQMNPISTANAEPVVAEQTPAPIATPVDGSVPSGPTAVVVETPTATVVTPPASNMPPATLPAPASAPLVVTTVPPASASNTVVATTGPYVQLGAFSNEGNATAMQQRYQSLGDISIAPSNVNGTPIYRVRVGPLLNEEAALEILERAEQMGVADAKIVTSYH